MRKISLFLLLMFVVVASFAAPAYRKAIKVNQSDGTELSVVLTGDEAFHFYTTLDGKPLVREANGDFAYAIFSSQGQFVSTKYLAHDKGARTLKENELIASIDYEQMMTTINKASNARSATFRAAAQKAGSQIAPEGDVNIAVVLVEFKDTKFTYTKEDINNLLNKKDFTYENPFADCIGSARDYFIAQSDGKFRPNFLVTDIVTLDNNMSYYGGNNSKGDDQKASYAIKEGIKKADETFDFSVCDNNGDGEVEFVYCIYAGYSESYGADENTIWPHQWSLSSQSGAVFVDGVKCNTYACSGELIYSEQYESEIGKVLAGIGLICHEFSHCLGLHDIYDVTYESGNWGMDYWDVMDQGNYAAEGYVPVGYSAYQRDFCGWRELVELDTKGDYSMQPLTQGGIAYKIVNEANSNEYYILENRKAEEWDTYLFNSGMLIIHVDYNKSAWDGNNINTVAGHPRYTLIPADNELAVYGEVTTKEFVASLKGDVWPGTSGNTELTNTSIPAAKVYAGEYMNKPIRNISYENDIISFNFMGGVFKSAPTGLHTTNITPSSFTANWNAVDGADEYNVELYKVTEVENGGDPETILNEDFVNCVKINTDISSNINDYTNFNGWTGKQIYSEGGIIRIGSSSNVGWLSSPTLSGSGAITLSFSTELYNINDSGSKLSVSIIDSNEKVIASEVYTPTSTSVNHELSANTTGNFYIKFSTEESTSKKRAKVDNIVLTMASSVASEIVAEVTTQGLNYHFDNLENGANYRYRVQAKDAYGVSDFSTYQNVSTTTTSIDELLNNGTLVNVYTLTGTKVYSGAKEGAKVIAPGVYIIKCGTKTFKAVLK